MDGDFLSEIIDFDEIKGKIRPMHAVNNAPARKTSRECPLRQLQSGRQSKERKCLR